MSFEVTDRAGGDADRPTVRLGGAAHPAAAHPAAADAAPVDPAAVDPGVAVDPAAADRAGRVPRALTLGTGACALLAIIFAVLLPLAPVQVNVPTVQWPYDPARPTSTLLHLTAYRPAALDLHFSCRAARAAADTDYSATVVSTVNPVLPEVADLGLIARVADKPDGIELTVDAVGTRLLKETLPAEECQYRVQGDPVGGLTLSRDGVPVGRGPAGVLPDVDVLATSIAALPDGTAADLGVTMRLDDEFATSPTGLKYALIGLLVLALTGVGVGLWRLDRAVSRVPAVWRVPRPHLADLAVLAAMLGWLLLAPSTDDDGYYAAMATNSLETGYVGNYYQLYDQSFVPITWFYQVLGWWQTVAGTAPVAQRGLALAAGLATWFVLRAFLSSAARETTREFEAANPADPADAMPDAGRLVRLFTPAVAAIAFLAWWLPQDMGVRPEGAVALLSMCALLGVWVAVRRRRLLAAFGACTAAGLALATHTTGFVGLAPLLAGAGGLWALVRAGGTSSTAPAGSRAGGAAAGVPAASRAGGAVSTAARALAVIAGGTTAALAGFADGSLRDFLRAQQIFLDIQPREYWYTEYLRWYFLLGEGAMGNYAKRVAVLVALVALLWFLGLSAASRVLAQHGRGTPLPGALRLSGWSLIASFGLLWLTPSKWTHHFGALAGVGPVFLTLLLVAAVPLARAVFGSERVPTPVLVGAAGSMLVVLALAGHGRNAWPYAWLTGFADVNRPPDVGPFTFGSVLSWAVVLAGCVLIGWLWTWRRGDTHRWGPATLRGVALFVVAGLLLNLVYLLGSFTVAARNTAAPDKPAQPWSLWGADVTDPWASRCGALDAVSVFDPITARPLPEVRGLDPDVELRPADPRTPTAGAGATAGTADDAAGLSGLFDLPGLSGLAGLATLPGLTGSGNNSGNSSATGSGTARGAGGTGTDDTAGEDDTTDSDTARSGQSRSQNGSQTGSRTKNTGFERAGGYYLGYQPPVQLGTGAATTVWGSLVAAPGKSPDRNTGEMRSPWYRLPAGLGADRALAVLLAGSPNTGNSLTAEYAAVHGRRLVRIEPGQQDTGETGTQSRNQTAAQRDPSQRDNGQLDPTAGRTGDLDDTGRDPRWRSVLLEPPPQAQFVRLHAIDDSAGAGGWLAFAAPAVQRLVPLRTMLDQTLSQAPGRPSQPDRPVALAWQIAYGYPCLRQPRIRDGITEAPAAAVLWADTPFNGTRDGTWLAFRGGIHGQVLRSQSPLQLTTRIKGMPAERRTEVLVFDSPLARDAYFLTTSQRLTAGWAQPVPTPTRTSNELERCVQQAAATGQPAAAARCVPKPVP